LIISTWYREKKPAMASQRRNRNWNLRLAGPIGPCDDYESEERKAIQDIKSGVSRAITEFGQEEQNNEDIEALRRKRDEAGRRMRAAKDPGRKDRLWREWTQLSTQIIELRKQGVRDGNR